MNNYKKILAGVLATSMVLSSSMGLAVVVFTVITANSGALPVVLSPCPQPNSDRQQHANKINLLFILVIILCLLVYFFILMNKGFLCCHSEGIG